METEEIIKLGKARGWLYVAEVAVLVGKTVKTLQNAHSARSGFMASAYKPPQRKHLRVPFEVVMGEIHSPR